ncbi:phenol hydroxylase subunit [Sphingopyxis sp. 550A]
MEGESPAQTARSYESGAHASSSDTVFDPSRKFVRVNGERRGLVEFDFGVGDLALSVEMMLPPEDFRQFCADQQATLVTASRDAAQGDEAVAMSWRPSDVQHLIERQASLPGEQ